MLAIARAMIRNADIIMLDEPFEGLAPLIVRDLMQVCRKLADEGHTIIIVEQNVRAALSLANRCYILNNGGVVRSEEHTSELQSLMRISYAVFCLKKTIYQQHINHEL